MKKVLLLTLALILSVSIFAQERSFLVKETFDSTKLPSGWSVYDSGTPNWKISLTNRAGGECNELMLYFDPGFDGVSHLAFKSVNLKNIESVAVSFKHYLDNFSGSSKIGIATSSDNGRTWSEAWSQTYSNTPQNHHKQQNTTPQNPNTNHKNTNKNQSQT